MKYPFDEIVIVYNPNSTGDSEENARMLEEKLANKLPKVTLTVIATEFAGHGEEFGASLARKKHQKLILSSSGDGGYNELINGVLSVGIDSTVVAVIPSGNANDHHHATASDDLVERVARGKSRPIDVLQLQGTSAGKLSTRYAHSYIGVGITPYIARQLNLMDLNPINEKWLVLKYLLRFKSVKLRLEKNVEAHRYASILFANIDRMSKVISLSENAELDDGEMEVYIHTRRSLWGYARTLFKGAVFGINPDRRVTSFWFATTEPLNVQCDGEVLTLDKETEATVKVVAKGLKTLTP